MKHDYLSYYPPESHNLAVDFRKSENMAVRYVYWLLKDYANQKGWYPDYHIEETIDETMYGYLAQVSSPEYVTRSNREFCKALISLFNRCKTARYKPEDENLVEDLFLEKRVGFDFLDKYLRKFADKEFWRVASDPAIELDDTISNALIALIGAVRQGTLFGCANKKFCTIARVKLRQVNIDHWRKRKNALEKGMNASQEEAGPGDQDLLTYRDQDLSDNYADEYFDRLDNHQIEDATPSILEILILREEIALFEKFMLESKLDKLKVRIFTLYVIEGYGHNEVKEILSEEGYSVNNREIAVKLYSAKVKLTIKGNSHGSSK